MGQSKGRVRDPHIPSSENRKHKAEEEVKTNNWESTTNKKRVPKRVPKMESNVVELQRLKSIVSAVTIYRRLG